MTGVVSGGMHKVVMPLAAAARVSEAIVPLFSKPGSLRRARKSTIPGMTWQPLASIICSLSRSEVKPSGCLPMAAMRPSEI